MEKAKYIKELMELYQASKQKGDIMQAYIILKELKEYYADPCGVDEFRKQANDS